LYAYKRSLILTSAQLYLNYIILTKLMVISPYYKKEKSVLLIQESLSLLFTTVRVKVHANNLLIIPFGTQAATVPAG